jgi:hypothetical protein
MIPIPNNDQEVKALAKQLLSDTDYTQLPDVQISNKAEFASYRKYLRACYDSPMPLTPFIEPPKTQWIDTDTIPSTEIG